MLGFGSVVKSDRSNKGEMLNYYVGLSYKSYFTYIVQPGRYLNKDASAITPLAGFPDTRMAIKLRLKRFVILE